MAHTYRMRTMLLVPLLLVSVGTTVLSLLIVQTHINNRIQSTLASDLDHSVTTFDNLHELRRATLRQESALLADLPSLKALMTSHDATTIQDGGLEFWKISGVDLFALATPNTEVVAFYTRSGQSATSQAIERMKDSLHRDAAMKYALVGQDLYEIAQRPVYFGSERDGSLLGYVIAGYLVDAKVAREVSQVAAADVVFFAKGDAVASTLDSDRVKALTAEGPEGGDATKGTFDFSFSNRKYVARVVQLAVLPDGAAVRLYVLKSYESAERVARQLNQWFLGMGAMTIATVLLLLFLVSRTVTGPLESLADGVRAFGAGERDCHLPAMGAREVLELSAAFQQMRREIQTAERGRIESERLATIGRMAYSISHDLRHYLTAMYANAEFMLNESLTTEGKIELLGEVRAAVNGMTDMIESLLVFSRSGSTVIRALESVSELLQRVIAMATNHPDAEMVLVQLDAPGQHDTRAWMDVKKVERAVYNLLLNACQAAKSSKEERCVTVTLSLERELIQMRIRDSGPGVPENLRDRMFEPFISQGKENGVGLGLTLAHRIAEEHGGGVSLESTKPGETIFLFTIARSPVMETGELETSKNSPEIQAKD